MADTLLHLTLANEIGNHPDVSSEIRNLIHTHPDDYLMGSVVFDLPYYELIFITGFRTLLHQPPVYHPYGECIHNSRCRQINVTLCTAAETPAQKALACGALTHFAVDIVFHREIEKRIQHQNISHDAFERQIGLHCHNALLGHSGVGSNYTQKVTWLFPALGWSSYVSATLKTHLACTPSSNVFEKWQRSLRLFGLLYSRSWFPWLNSTIEPHPELPALADSLIKGIRPVNTRARKFF
ncbi:MAG: zinc dependent phospholipase C family protein [Deltaproteobacteria bacterium]|nr:zinc dependent phospholipase C family protein [Deltaproteobacteria bacterium]